MRAKAESDSLGGDGAADRILTRAQTEIDAGRLWRAREILCGAVRTHPTDLRILESYGRLLDRLGDRVEAGKYLFLSGKRGPDVDEAIALFVTRHGRGHLSNLLAQFPQRVRSAGTDAFPPVVGSELEALGLPKGRKPDASIEARTAPPGWRQSLALGGCAALALLLVTATVVGLGVMATWLF